MNYQFLWKLILNVKWYIWNPNWLHYNSDLFSVVIHGREVACANPDTPDTIVTGPVRFTRTAGTADKFAIVRTMLSAIPAMESVLVHQDFSDKSKGSSINDVTHTYLKIYWPPPSYLLKFVLYRLPLPSPKNL